VSLVLLRLLLKAFLFAIYSRADPKKTGSDGTSTPGRCRRPKLTLSGTNTKPENIRTVCGDVGAALSSASTTDRLATTVASSLDARSTLLAPRLAALFVDVETSLLSFSSSSLSPTSSSDDNNENGRFVSRTAVDEFAEMDRQR
jgi:hypothetical protein